MATALEARGLVEVVRLMIAPGRFSCFLPAWHMTYTRRCHPGPVELSSKTWQLRPQSSPTIDNLWHLKHLKLETNHHLWVSPPMGSLVISSRRLHRFTLPPLQWDHCHRPQRCLGQCHRACWDCLHPSCTGARSCPGPMEVQFMPKKEDILWSARNACRASGWFWFKTVSATSFNLSDLGASIQPRLWHRKFGCPTPQPCLWNDSNANFRDRTDTTPSIQGTAYATPNRAPTPGRTS